MKIIFFGTPDFAVPSLRILLESEYDVVAVVTAPDKPRGRGRGLSPTPVKQFALENNINVLTPEKLKDPSLVTKLKSLNPDLFVIVAFRILPESVFTIPVKGSFNLHGSLLPKYRGAAPIQWALINGEDETGLTTFFLEKKVDTGNIILKEKIKIDESDNFGSLHDKMSVMGANLVLKTVNLISDEIVELTMQDDNIATPAPKITKEICEINWENIAKEIHNLIRGLSPIPGAFFKLKGKVYKVFSSQIVENQNLGKGEILQTKNELIIGTSQKSIEILKIQPEGRRSMTIKEFLRGYSLI